MTTRTIQVNDNNDMYLPDGRNLFIISGEPAMTQVIRAAHLMRKGEDLYDVENGVDYFGTIFNSPSDVDGFRKSISDAILKKPDVRAIESLAIDVTGEVCAFTAEVITVYGNTIKVSG